VLRAIGLPPEVAAGTIRLTLGRWTTDADADYLLEVIPGIVADLRQPLKSSAVVR
jgi:cysteine desulfurase